MVPETLVTAVKGFAIEAVDKYFVEAQEKNEIETFTGPCDMKFWMAMPFFGWKCVKGFGR